MQLRCGIHGRESTGNVQERYTDFWSAYDLIFPDLRNRSVGKQTGLTTHIERLNNTLRQRVSPLIRKTLSFSKKLENH